MKFISIPNKSKLSTILSSLVIASFIQTANASILQVDYSSLSGIAGADFEDLGLGDYEQVTFDDIFESNNTSFGESFVGQTVTTVGDFDVLTGSPTGPLSLVAGGVITNVTAVDGGAGDVGNTAIAGSGPLGYPHPDAAGEGSIAILFDFDQSEFGFEIVGANGGTATAQFWARDGSLLDEIVFDLGNDVFTPFGFITDDASFSVAGVSIFNDDPGGVGFDNFIYNVAGVPGTPGASVPEPSSFILLALGLVGGALSRRKKS